MQKSSSNQIDYISIYNEKYPHADNPQQYVSAGIDFIQDLCKQALLDGKTIEFSYGEGLDELNYKFV